jgi:hypothetical protein
MAYWAKRICLKTGEVVTERELRTDENLFQGDAPVVGDTIKVVCCGRSFDARVVWGNWPGRNEGRASDAIVPLRVEEI